MGNIESVDGQSEMMKHHIMPLKVPMPDPTELEEKFAIVLVSFWINSLFSFIFFFNYPSAIPFKLKVSQKKVQHCAPPHGDNKKQHQQPQQLTKSYGGALF